MVAIDAKDSPLSTGCHIKHHIGHDATGNPIFDRPTNSLNRTPAVTLSDTGREIGLLLTVVIVSVMLAFYQICIWKDHRRKEAVRTSLREKNDIESMAIYLTKSEPPPYHDSAAASDAYSVSTIATDNIDSTWVSQLVIPAVTPAQLEADVEGIEIALGMVEEMCIEIDKRLASSSGGLEIEQYQASIALHRLLLYQYDDYLHAIQHPSANPELRVLATKGDIPARMWRNGIYSFLEVLRHRLPDSLEHIRVFLNFAYSMIGDLVECAPLFEETWMEFLGDLARYRMGIEDSDVERDKWSGIAKRWYHQAVDKHPGTGRLQHRLAGLARPDIIQQLFYHSQALVSVTPYEPARASVIHLFNRLTLDEAACQQYHAVEAAFVNANSVGIMVEYQPATQFPAS